LPDNPALLENNQGLLKIFPESLAGFGIFAYLCSVKTSERQEVAAHGAAIFMSQTYWYRYRSNRVVDTETPTESRLDDFNSA